MPKQDKKTIGRSVNVHLRPGQKVLVKTTPTSHDIERSFFIRWAGRCTKFPPDVWPIAVKHHPKCNRRECACGEPSIAIADMHTMQLVNAIKWCVKMADRELRGRLFAHFDESRASLLARVPQWGALLQEAKKRNLYMIQGGIQYAHWFEKALSAVVFRRLDGNKSP